MEYVVITLFLNCIFVREENAHSMGKIRYYAETDNNSNVLKAAVGIVRSIVDIDCLPKGVEIIYNQRNRLFALTLDQKEYVIKCFKVPIFIQRIVYTFIRPSKAVRSYRNAIKLKSLEIDNPAPIGVAIEYSNGLLSNSYYLSERLSDACDIRPLMSGKIEDDGLLKILAHYIADLHRKGIYHIDLSPGNILRSKEKHGHFYLVDLNRMKFFDSPLSEEMCYKNLGRLSDNYDVTSKFVRFYVEEMGFKYGHAEKLIQKYSDGFFLKKVFTFAKRDLKRNGFAHPRRLLWQFRIVRFLRKLTGSTKFFSKEQSLYNLYIKRGDVRQALLRQEGYSE